MNNNLKILPVFAAINITENTINDIMNVLPEGVSLPPELQNVNIPNAEEATKLFKDKCEKISGSDAAFEEAHVSFNFTVCPFLYFIKICFGCSKLQRVSWNACKH